TVVHGERALPERVPPIERGGVELSQTPHEAPAVLTDHRLASRLLDRHRLPLRLGEHGAVAPELRGSAGSDAEPGRGLVVELHADEARRAAQELSGAVRAEQLEH